MRILSSLIVVNFFRDQQFIDVDNVESKLNCSTVHRFGIHPKVDKTIISTMQVTNFDDEYKDIIEAIRLDHNGIFFRCETLPQLTFERIQQIGEQLQEALRGEGGQFATDVALKEQFEMNWSSYCLIQKKGVWKFQTLGQLLLQRTPVRDIYSIVTQGYLQYISQQQRQILLADGFPYALTGKIVGSGVQVEPGMILVRSNDQIGTMVSNGKFVRRFDRDLKEINSGVDVTMSMAAIDVDGIVQNDKVIGLLQDGDHKKVTTYPIAQLMNTAPVFKNQPIQAK